MFDVKNKRAIVTGSARGIGKAMAKELLIQGCKVCLCDVLEEEGNKTKMELQEEFRMNDGSICFVKCDVSSKADWENLWQTAEKTLGGQIDLLCNNAGIPPQKDISKCMSVMAVGTALGTMMAVQRMEKSGGGNGGRIVNIASVAGLEHMGKTLEMGGYTSAKYAIVALTRSFSKNSSKESEGIKCYALAPWAADTNMIHQIYDDKQFTVANGMGEDVHEFLRKNGSRMLKPVELASALMKVLKADKNGAVFCVVPDFPLIEYPSVDNQLFTMNMMMAKFLAGRLDTLSANQFCFGVLAMVFIMVYVLQCVISFLLGLF